MSTSSHYVSIQRAGHRSAVQDYDARVLQLMCETYGWDAVIDHTIPLVLHGRYVGTTYVLTDSAAEIYANMCLGR